MSEIAGVQSCFVQVEAVAILHEELADAQEASLGAGLVAELGLDLVPDLGELLVGTDFGAGDGGHDLLVGHAQAQLRALAIRQPKHILAHAGPTAGLFPELARVDGGQEKLLADAVHLLADDGHNLVNGPVAEEEVRVNACAELADIAGAQQELVAGNLGVGGSFAQSGDKEFGPAVHDVVEPSGRVPAAR
jgi:hypothetical protein